MPRSKGTHKQPTCTSRIEDALRNADDFMSVSMLMEKCTCTNNQTFAALHHLRNRHVVDVIINGDGTSWWYARPKEEDNRTKRVELRTPEEAPRKKRVYKRRTKLEAK